MDGKPARGVAIFGLSGLFALSFSSPGIGLLWNVSSSVPAGLYLVHPETTLHRGDMVAALMPAEVRALATSRHYLAPGIPLLKRVSALPGERLCVAGAIVMVGGRKVAERRARDPGGRRLPGFTGCRRLGRSQYLLLGDSQLSFDGRYFGPSEKRDILGRAQFLWAR